MSVRDADSGSFFSDFMRFNDSNSSSIKTDSTDFRSNNNFHAKLAGFSEFADFDSTSTVKSPIPELSKSVRISPEIETIFHNRLL